LYWNPILNKITSIKLWNNKITKVNIDDLAIIPNLNNLELNNNQITSVELDLKLLKTINLANNKITSWNNFKVWDSIKNINLSGNWLDDLEWFKKYKNVIAADLSNNKLNEKDLKNFWWNKKIQYLLLDWNKDISKDLINKIEKYNSKYLKSKSKKVNIKSSTWSTIKNTWTWK
jgi:hypothetical protein